MLCTCPVSRRDTAAMLSVHAPTRSLSAMSIGQLREVHFPLTRRLRDAAHRTMHPTLFRPVDNESYLAVPFTCRCECKAATLLECMPPTACGCTPSFPTMAHTCTVYSFASAPPFFCMEAQMHPVTFTTFSPTLFVELPHVHCVASLPLSSRHCRQ